MRDLQVIISDWNKFIAAMENAIKIRNYDFFSVAVKHSHRCFLELQTLLESNMRKNNLTDEEREMILTTTRYWSDQVEGIKIWQTEIEAEAKKVHKSISVEKKLSNAYKYIQKSGNNLRFSR